MKIEDEIKLKANELGFEACGITLVQKLENEEKHLKKWLDRGFHGNMNYMENYFEKRISPQLLEPDTQSIISVIINYHPQKTLSANNNYSISKYTYGIDYHYVIKNKLSHLISFLQNKFPNGRFRCFVDSAPVLEKTWAMRAGLGWIGKNSCLINKHNGSFCFIGEIFSSILFTPDKPEKNHCGNCTACIDNCPTGAIIEPFVIDARKCISYQTIENKNNIPNTIRNKMGNQIYGCDICQDVCPWNKRFLKKTKCNDFEASEMLQLMNTEKWENLSKSEFKKLTKNSAMNRVKFEKLKQNIQN